MPNVLSDLEVREVSLVDRPACAETDPATGQKIPRARVALVKRDEPVAKSVKYLVSGKDTGNHLPYTGPDGKPDHRLMGAAWAALHEGYRGNKYQGPGKDAAIARLKQIYEQEQMDTPAVQKGDTSMTLEQIEKSLTDQAALIAKLQADNDALKSENTVAKMPSKEKKAFGGMTQKQKDDYMAADTDKRKSMMDAACKDMQDEPDVDEDTEDAKKHKKKGGTAKSDITPTQEEILKSELAARDVRILKAETELAAIRKQERLNAFVAKAEKELPNTAGTAVQKGTDLMAVADALGGESTEAFQRHMATIKSADQLLGVQMREIGKWGGGKSSAHGQLEAKADEIAKRDKISKSAAYGKAMIENPDLYTQCEKESGALPQ